MDRRPLWTCGLSAMLLLPASASADTAINLSSGFAIQQIQPDPLLRPTTPSAAPLNAPLDSPPAPEQADQVFLQLNQLQLQGNRVLSAAQLADAWQPLLGQRIRLAQLYQLANSLTRRYHAAGYVFAQVIVPAQTIQDGRVRLQVFEGQIGHVQLLGDGAGQPLARAYAAKLQQQQPIHQRDLERYLLLLNDLSGVDARPFVQPSTELGVMNLLIQLSPETPYHQVGVHNRTSPALGEVRAEAAISQGNLLQQFEQHYWALSSSLSSALGSMVYQAQLPVGSDGAQASLTLSGSQVEPKLNGRVLSTSQSWLAGVGLQYPIVRARQRNVYAYGQLEWSHNQRDSAFDNTRENQEDVRALNMGVRWEWVDDWAGVNQVDWSSALGLAMLGASRSGDRLLSGSAGQGNPQFFKQNIAFARVQPLQGTWSLLSAAQGQWSDDVLLSGQQFTAGGGQYLRAYDPGELSGERGIALKLELRYQRNAWRSTWTHYSFLDYGEVQQRSISTSGRQRQLGDHAASIGLGTRFSLPYRLQGYLEAAKPYSRPTNHAQSTDARVFGGLSVHF